MIVRRLRPRSRRSSESTHLQPNLGLKSPTQTETLGSSRLLHPLLSLATGSNRCRLLRIFSAETDTFGPEFRQALGRSSNRLELAIDQDESTPVAGRGFARSAAAAKEVEHDIARA